VGAKPHNRLCSAMLAPLTTTLSTRARTRGVHPDLGPFRHSVESGGGEAI
jgi:hypothetical protein